MPNPLDTVKSSLATFAGLDRLEEAVIVRINNEIYDAWEGISIARSIEHITSGFSISLTDRWRDSKDNWPIKPGEQLKINIGKDPVLNGYIDELNVSVSKDDRTIEAMGRDKTGDIVDCSVVGSVELKNVTIEDIAIKFVKELFGINVIVEAHLGDKFKTWTIEQGETVAETLHRAAKLRGLLIVSDTDGNLVITNRAGVNIADIPSVKFLTKDFDFAALASQKQNIRKATADLLQGFNVLAASARFDNSNRFSDYLVKGQAKGSDNFFGKKVTEIQATAKDLGINRFRPLTILAEGSVDKNTAQLRANWEATNRAADAVEVSITVQGWREQPGGNLWTPNSLVTCNVPFIGVEAELLISDVNYIKNASGTFTEISLTRPDAYNPSTKEVCKDNDPVNTLGWKFDKDKVKKIKALLGDTNGKC